MTEAPPRRRRSLTHVGGAVTTSGDPEASAALAHALDVPLADEDDPDAEDRAHVHGFHAYPARTHPLVSRRLIDAFAPKGGELLDPFAGSGTVLAEAMLAGHDARGTDLNPLAVMLATCKTRRREAGENAELVAEARRIGESADARRLAKAGATRRLPYEDVSLFAPHVLLELDGLRAAIEEAPSKHRADLYLVLSSILVKLSAKRADTARTDGNNPVAATNKRLAAGYPARLFVKKTEELTRRLDAFAELLPSPRPRAKLTVDDGTTLTKIKDASIDAIVTSPPYVATYDYLAHHDLRMRWLGLDLRSFARGEMGARRSYENLSPTEARAAWKSELARLLSSLARVTKRGAPVVLLIADSAVLASPARGGAEALRADELVAEVANAGGALTVVACASQARPHFHRATEAAFRRKARAEHAILLRRK